MKKLIYFCIDSDYKDILDISLNSLVKNSNLDNIDILILTSDENLKVNNDIYLLDNTMNKKFDRTRIFEYPKIKEYDKILYIDSDIIVRDDISGIFKVYLEDKLYTRIETFDINHHNKEAFGVCDYTEDDLEFFESENILPFNTGTFMMNNSHLMREHFMNVLEMVKSNSEKFENYPNRWPCDQSFMNKYFNILNLSDTKLMEEWVHLNPPEEKSITTNKTIIHFLGNMFNGDNKKYRMIKHIMRDKIKNRLDLTKQLNNLFPNGKGVEVGSYEGSYSNEILENWNGTLYSVDVWRELNPLLYEQNDHWEHNNSWTEIMDSFINKNDHFGDRSIMIRTTSKNASKIFCDESLDFIYIDANHSYEEVKKDLEYWFPKLKTGGIFSGHDYLKIDWEKDPNFAENGKDRFIYSGENNAYYNGLFGVNPAVNEFLKEKEMELNTTTEEWWGTWWSIKN